MLGKEVAPGFRKVCSEVAVSGDEKEAGCEDDVDGNPPFEEGKPACGYLGVGVERLD